MACVDLDILALLRLNHLRINNVTTGVATIAVSRFHTITATSVTGASDLLIRASDGTLDGSGGLDASFCRSQISTILRNSMIYRPSHRLSSLQLSPLLSSTLESQHARSVGLQHEPQLSGVDGLAMESLQQLSPLHLSTSESEHAEPAGPQHGPQLSVAGGLATESLQQSPPLHSSNFESEAAGFVGTQHEPQLSGVDGLTAKPPQRLPAFSPTLPEQQEAISEN